MSTSLRISALFLLLATACHTGAPGDTVPADQTRARIENQNSVDMDIYVRRTDGRVSRLGFVPANQSATFALPAGLTAGSAGIQFEARPALGSGEPAVSEQFPVKQGDEISWSVPPQ
ncbi:MAG TPA: hypothetical protein VGN76_12195 [Gemmatimonadales bacterium]|nr:hypothetical protein [Gemmatimonadales bacterium]